MLECWLCQSKYVFSRPCSASGSILGCVVLYQIQPHESERVVARWSESSRRGMYRDPEWWSIAFRLARLSYRQAHQNGVTNSRMVGKNTGRATVKRSTVIHGSERDGSAHEKLVKRFLLVQEGERHPTQGLFQQVLHRTASLGRDVHTIHNGVQP